MKEERWNYFLKIVFWKVGEEVHESVTKFWEETSCDKCELWRREKQEDMAKLYLIHRFKSGSERQIETLQSVISHLNSDLLTHRNIASITSSHSWFLIPYLLLNTSIHTTANPTFPSVLVLSLVILNTFSVPRIIPPFISYQQKLVMIHRAQVGREANGREINAENCSGRWIGRGKETHYRWVHSAACLCHIKRWLLPMKLAISL